MKAQPFCLPCICGASSLLPLSFPITWPRPEFVSLTTLSPPSLSSTCDWGSLSSAWPRGWKRGMRDWHSPLCESRRVNLALSYSCCSLWLSLPPQWKLPSPYHWVTTLVKCLNKSHLLNLNAFGTRSRGESYNCLWCNYGVIFLHMHTHLRHTYTPTRNRSLTVIVAEPVAKDCSYTDSCEWGVIMDQVTFNCVQLFTLVETRLSIRSSNAHIYLIEIQENP